MYINKYKMYRKWLDSRLFEMMALYIYIFLYSVFVGQMDVLSLQTYSYAFGFFLFAILFWYGVFLYLPIIYYAVFHVYELWEMTPRRYMRINGIVSFVHANTVFIILDTYGTPVLGFKYVFVESIYISMANVIIAYLVMADHIEDNNKAL